MTITRNTERRRASQRTTLLTVGVSFLLHAIIVAVLVPGWLEKLKTPPPEPPSELEIEALYEEPEPPQQPEPQPDPPTPALAQPQPTPQELSPEIVDSAPTPSMTVASREPDPQPAPIERAEPPPAPALENVEPEPSPVEEQSPIILKQPKPNPRRLLMPSVADYDRVFAKRDVEVAERAKELGRGKRLFANYEDNKEGIKKALTTFGQAVKPGNHTGVDPHSKSFGSYVGMIHNKIHLRWANGYLMDLDLQEPAGSPMNDPSLNTLLELVIRAADGELEQVNIVRSSGQLRFDAQAISIVHSTGPHPGAPPDLVSPDGKVYMHWNFWRDQRQCGVFGASVFMVQERGGGSPG